MQPICCYTSLVALEFNQEGNLIAGIHPVSQHRAILLGGLRAALVALALAGSRKVWIDGSFASLKPNPNDIDVCYDDSSIDFDLLDPVLLEFDHARAAQKQKFGCECFGASWIAEPITQLNFLAYFQFDRLNRPKGILELDLSPFAPPKKKRRRKT
jgi:hypothetical protein